MTRANILAPRVDRLAGTLFPDGPVDWLHAPNLKRLAARAPVAIEYAAEGSQARRHRTYAALRAGRSTASDHQPHRAVSERFMRNHMDRDVVEEHQRFPRAE